MSELKVFQNLWLLIAACDYACPSPPPPVHGQGEAFSDFSLKYIF